MRLILSRKGFDSGYGGYPSPILPDGRPVSLPIPDRDGIPYSALRVNDDLSFSDLMRQLGISRIRAGRNGRLELDGARAHLDPDVAPGAIDRLPGWLPCFGQVGGPQGHLRNQGVGPGDLFLFFGWFRRTVETPGGLRYDKSEGFQALWGYLEVGKVLSVAATPDPPDWAAYHQHFASRDRPRFAKPSNTVYVATPRLSWAAELPGAGTFGSFRPVHRLTCAAGPASLWDLPEAFHPSRTAAPLTFHGSPARWAVQGSRVLLDAAKQGQEFVVAATPGIRRWVADLLPV